MSEITIQFEYPVPDEQYHQTADQNKIGRIKYKGPAKKYLWINNTTNTIHSEYPDEIADPEMKKYFHDTSHELYIDVSDLLD